MRCAPRGSRLARHLCESADDGEPRRITLRELRRSSLAIASNTPVFICENPGVVNAAADQLGAQAAALVCVEGIPTTAALELLTGLARDGASLRFHGDFDWWGIRIGNVLAPLGARCWRFGAEDYLRAAGTGLHDVQLAQEPVTASWDPELHLAMRRTGFAIFEEQVLADLLADLRSGPIA